MTRLPAHTGLKPTMFVATYKEIFRRLPLIAFMVRRDNKARVAHFALGIFWDVITPASNMLIYYFLIAVVFQRASDYAAPAYLFIIIGISHYMFFQRALTTAGQSIVSSESIMMQVAIEPLVFTAVELRRALRDFSVYVTLCIILYIIAMPSIPATVIYYPLLIIALVIMAWSFGVVLATLTVFMRDITNFVPIVLRILLYTSSVIYPLSFVPEQYRDLYFLNPVAVWFSALQWCLYGGEPPPLRAILIAIGIVVTTFIFGHWLYESTKTKFTRAF